MSDNPIRKEGNVPGQKETPGQQMKNPPDVNPKPGQTSGQEGDPEWKGRTERHETRPEAGMTGQQGKTGETQSGEQKGQAGQKPTGGQNRE